MADTSPPVLSGGLEPPPGSTTAPSEKSTEAVEMKTLATSADEADEAGPKTPAKDTMPDVDAEGGPSSASKGKAKDAAEPGKDSLSIDRTDDAAAAVGPDGGPVCNITLLLPTGARHPYRIDEKYLSKRSVEVPELTEEGKMDPFSISIYKLKELILREWREEWDGKPASPSSIRLIHFGKLLEDKEQLKKYHFSAGSPNVVHMSVRPAEMMEEEEGAKGKGSGRDGRNGNGGNGCCVIL